MHSVAYASRALLLAEQNYSISELETLAVVWAIQYFHVYLYGHQVTVITDHSGKHARWWTKIFSSRVDKVDIVYRPGKDNGGADALSRNPLPFDGEVDDQSQVALLSTTERLVEIPALMELEPSSPSHSDFDREQRQDPNLNAIIHYLEDGELPADEQIAKQIVLRAAISPWMMQSCIM